VTSIALALALASQQPQPAAPAWYRAWRVVERPGLHVGVRPAIFVDNEADGAVEWGAGATVQVTAGW
jgi:hypothetical protein